MTRRQRNALAAGLCALAATGALVQFFHFMIHGPWKTPTTRTYDGCPEAYFTNGHAVDDDIWMHSGSPKYPDPLCVVVDPSTVAGVTIQVFPYPYSRDSYPKFIPYPFDSLINVTGMNPDFTNSGAQFICKLACLTAAQLNQTLSHITSGSLIPAYSTQDGDLTPEGSGRVALIILGIAFSITCAVLAACVMRQTPELEREPSWNRFRMRQDKIKELEEKLLVSETRLEEAEQALEKTRTMLDDERQRLAVIPVATAIAPPSAPAAATKGSSTDDLKLNDAFALTMFNNVPAAERTSRRSTRCAIL